MFCQRQRIAHVLWPQNHRSHFFALNVECTWILGTNAFHSETDPGRPFPSLI